MQRTDNGKFFFYVFGKIFKRFDIFECRLLASIYKIPFVTLLPKKLVSLTNGNFKKEWKIPLTERSFQFLHNNERMAEMLFFFGRILQIVNERWEKRSNKCPAVLIII